MRVIILFIIRAILVMLFGGLLLLVCIGGYLEMRSKYWRRKWIQHGKPMVYKAGSPDRYPSVKELKYLIREGE